MTDSGRARGQFALLLITLVVTQSGLQAIRPLISYRTIAMGGGGFEVGIAAASFALLSVLVALPLGRFTDRTGRTLTLLMIGAILCAGATATVAAAPNLPVVIIGSALLGLAHVLLMVGAQGHVAKVAREDRLDSGFGWMAAAVSAGQLLGPLMAGFSLGAGAVSVESTAHAARIATVAAIAAIPIAIVLAATGRVWATNEPSTIEGSPSARLAAMTLIRRPGVFSALVTSLALLAAVDILTAYLPLVGQERNIAATTIGALLALRAGASLVSRAGLGKLAARWGHDQLVAMSTLGSGVAIAVLALPVSNLWVLVPAALIGGFLLGIGQPLTMTLVVRSVPPEGRGAALALRLVANRLGQVGLPALASITTAWLGASGALWFAAAVLAASEAANRHHAAGALQPASEPSD